MHEQIPKISAGEMLMLQISHKEALSKDCRAAGVTTVAGKGDPCSTRVREHRRTPIQRNQGAGEQDLDMR